MNNIFKELLIYPLSVLLITLFTIFKDFGISIMLFSFLLKIFLIPLSLSQFLEEKKMKKVKERIDKETKNFKDLFKKIEIMNKIYEEEKFNPAKSIFINLITIPIYLAVILAIYDVSKKIPTTFFINTIDLLKPNIYLAFIGTFLNFYYVFKQPQENRKILLFVLGIISIIIFTLPSFVVLYFIVILVLNFIERKLFEWYYIKFVIKSI